MNFAKPAAGSSNSDGRQADDHAELADNLSTSAARWEQHEEDQATSFGSLRDDLR